MFAPFTSPLVKTLCVILFSAFGGLYPGTAFALAPRFAARPSHIALMAGIGFACALALGRRPAH